jgi:hypothetical protein
MNNKYVQLGIVGLLVIIFIGTLQFMQRGTVYQKPQEQQSQAIPKEEEKPQNEIDPTKRTELLKEIEDFTAGIDFDSTRANKLIEKAGKYESDSLTMSKLNSFKNTCIHVETARLALKRDSVIMGKSVRGSLDSFQWIYNTYNLNPEQKAEIKLFIDVMTAVKKGTKLQQTPNISNNHKRNKRVSKFLKDQKLR